MYIKEILLKEEEKHQLTYIGLVDDWTKVVRTAEKSFVSPQGSFADNKELLLTMFYSSTLCYEKFIREERDGNTRLKQHHFKKTAAYLTSLRKEKKAALDEELKTPQRISFAWHFSFSLYENIYESFCRDDSPIKRPPDTDKFFFNKVEELYPLDMKQLTEQLENDDASFWELCARYMQSLSRTTVAFALQRSNTYGFSDLIKDQTWTDVYRLMRVRLVDRVGRIPVFGNGNDFRNFLIKACKLTAVALQRQYAQKGACMEDLPEHHESLPTNEDYENDMPEDELCVPDINTANPYEVASAVSIVLLNTEHPLYKSLTEGIEDKVRILVDKAVNNMSYQDIISEKYYEDSLREADFQKAVVKARKDYERVRKTLCERMRQLVERKMQAGVTNPTSVT
ncbi:MAG: hypothetical protein LBB84_06800 [Tannerellaceae bacterium]|jgi:hypothetical protein|nr:hypothetical protein [Tannerellaceae bacterium]